ncbi:hypothetical protein EDC01DRAFT_702716 [Geopyxis carbonaria]|nr:hypothetical protein EDC01DRAFT_702716 [Geopyxis carbonaria]
MQLSTLLGLALLGLGAVEGNSHASRARRHVHHHHHQSKHVELPTSPMVEKRQATTCGFPTDGPELVAVTPDQQNGGWAMAPNMPCTAGMYCPYACKPGKEMAQWDPASTYADNTRVNGGLKCNDDGTTSKSFPDQPYCVDGANTVSAKNNAGADVAICQTVLPGYEDMLIPTNAGAGMTTTLNIPGTEYWGSTSAHYYINAPGVSTQDGCVWGSVDNPIGNWAPYVAGGNLASDGNTYVKIGWNPVYFEEPNSFKDTRPNFGISIECDGDGCSGLPCSIDPAVNAVNEMTGPSVVSGAGAGTGCTIGVRSGSRAFITIFDATPGA